VKRAAVFNPFSELSILVRRASGAELDIIGEPAKFVHRSGTITKLRGRIPFMVPVCVIRREARLAARTRNPVTVHECKSHVVAAGMIGRRRAAAV
jgi:hypothetical protein